MGNKDEELYFWAKGWHMLLTHTKRVTWSRKTKGLYSEYGYTADFGDILDIDIKYISKDSHMYVHAMCDYCKRIYKPKYQSYNRGRKIIEKDSCKFCQELKARDSIFAKYGVSSVMKLDEIKQKMYETNIARYGTKFPQSLELFSEKARKTTLERYGVEYYTQLAEAQDRIVKTNIKKYGCERPTQNQTVKDKVVKTLIERYGVDNPTKNSKILAKSINTRYLHGNFTCSTQQWKIHEIIGGELDFPFGNFVLDIAYPNDKIVVEYCGSGHDLSVRLGKIARSAFDRNENYRRIFLFNNKWSIIEITSKKDKLPSNYSISSIIEYCILKIQLYDCHYIIIDIDNNTIMIHKKISKICNSR